MLLAAARQRFCSGKHCGSEFQHASERPICRKIKGISTVAKKLGISLDAGKGYRTLSNLSEHGGQEVPHLHFHLFGGEKVGKMVE